MQTQKEKGQIEEILRELGKKIDQLIEDAKGAKDTIRDDIEIQIAELKNKKSEIEDNFKEYKQKDGRWDDVKDHLEKALSELKKAASSAFH